MGQSSPVTITLTVSEGDLVMLLGGLTLLERASADIYRWSEGRDRVAEAEHLRRVRELRARLTPPLGKI